MKKKQMPNVVSMIEKMVTSAEGAKGGAEAAERAEKEQANA